MFHDPYSGFEELILENGLTIYLQERPQVAWFQSSLIVHAGGREDLPEREGLGHLVEHLVSKNIPDMSYMELQDYVKRLGGYGMFGETRYLATKYYLKFPADQEKMQKAFQLFGTMLLTLQLQSTIEAEKEVVVQEYHRKYSHPEARRWAQRGLPLSETYPFMDKP